MGGNYDYFGEASHVFYEDITAKQKAARMYLRRVMLKHGWSEQNMKKNGGTLR